MNETFSYVSFALSSTGKNFIQNNIRQENAPACHVRQHREPSRPFSIESDEEPEVVEPGSPSSERFGIEFQVFNDL